MSLHPEVLKMIEAGPHEGMGWTYERPENEREFARRCVEFAVEKEREECAKVCEAVRGPYVCDGYIDRAAFEDACDACAEYIRQRGKP